MVSSSPRIRYRYSCHGLGVRIMTSLDPPTKRSTLLVAAFVFGLLVGVLLGQVALEYNTSSTAQAQNSAISVSCLKAGLRCATIVGSPLLETISGVPALVANFTNNSNGTQRFIFFATVHNSTGQTVFATTTAISPESGKTEQAFFFLTVTFVPHWYLVDFSYVSAVNSTQIPIYAGLNETLG